MAAEAKCLIRIRRIGIQFVEISISFTDRFFINLDFYAREPFYNPSRFRRPRQCQEGSCAN
jgi:hypothetical protein